MKACGLIIALLMLMPAAGTVYGQSPSRLRPPMFLLPGRARRQEVRGIQERGDHDAVRNGEQVLDRSVGRAGLRGRAEVLQGDDHRLRPVGIGCPVLQWFQATDSGAQRSSIASARALFVIFPW